MKCLIFLLFVFSSLPALAAQGWEGCSEKVIEKLTAQGLREHGDSSAYIGASGAGAVEDIVNTCGYKPMTKDDCDDIYINSYLSCRNNHIEGSDFGLSGVEMSWVRGYDPKILNPDRLDQLCKMKDRLSRQEFGEMMCGM
jgi:hypothetical protein